MKTFINIIIAIFVILILIKSCNRISEVNSWPEAKAVIIEYEIEEYRDSETYKDKQGKKRTKWEDEYRIKFTYSFEVEGVEYTGEFDIDDLESDSEIRRKLKRYPEGKQIRVKYDPENPYDNEARL